MAKLLMIRISVWPIHAKRNGVIKAVESEIFLKMFEVYDSRSVAETIRLLDMHQFNAILIVALGSIKNSNHLHDRLAEYAQTGGTLILTSGYLNACLPSPCGGSEEEPFYHQFTNEYRRATEYSICHYVLSRSYENVDKETCAVPDEADPDYTAAIVKRGEGFIGSLDSTEEGPIAQTLLLLMLDHADKSSDPPPATDATTSLLSRAASQQPPSQPPQLIGANPGCAVCQVLVPAKKCGNCRLIQYCSTKCQNADWKSHQATCIVAAEEDDTASSSTGQWTPATMTEA